jgi:hypothetical protein
MLTSHPGPEGATTPLPAPLERLVADHTLNEQQARAVLRALAAEWQPAVVSEPRKAPRNMAGRLTEIGAYLGAGLVVAAGIVVVAQQWADMTYGVRVGVMTGVTLVLMLAALTPVVIRRQQAWADLPNGETLRRLSGTLLTLGAIAGYGTVMVAMLSGQARVTDTEGGWASILGALLAFAILLVARWQADTPLSEMAMFAAVTAGYFGVIQLTANDRTVVIQWTLLGLGVSWAVIATFTRWMRHQMLIASLGLIEAFFAAATIAEVTWSQRLALGVLITFTLGVYLLRPSWPYITAGTLSAVVLTVTWVGEAVGPAVALLAAGLVLLLVTGGALMLRRHQAEAAADSSQASA